MSTGDLTELIETVFAQGRSQTFAPGSVLQFQGDSCDELILLEDGAAEARFISADGDQTVLFQLSAGELIEDAAHILGEMSAYEIVAATHVRARLIAKRRILNHPDAQNKPWALLSYSVARKLKSLLAAHTATTTLSVYGRVCAHLLAIAKPSGVEPDRLVIRPSPVFSELGQRLNTTRETVSRTVSDLQKKQIVRRETGALIVDNPHMLRALVR